MNPPDKPTSGSWLTDLLALRDMGATSVDIRTAVGAVDELRDEIELHKQNGVAAVLEIGRLKDELSKTERLGRAFSRLSLMAGQVAMDARTQIDALVAALEPFAKHAERVDAADEECGHMPDYVNLDGSLGAAQMPSMGDCRIASAALARVRGGT